ncbi:MAG: bifunctional riboflavin kinase/FMN adenylyltransferase, partial [Chloroflexota bacterium]
MPPAMLLQQELSIHTPDRPTVCTIGVFDGVHRGHHALLRETVAAARKQNALSAVLVFHPHPRTVLSPGAVVPLLTSLDERLELIRARGIDLAIPVS